MDRRDDDQEEHCVDQRCERLQWENFYLRTQLEHILQELHQVGSNNADLQKPGSKLALSNHRLSPTGKSAFASLTRTLQPKDSGRTQLDEARRFIGAYRGKDDDDDDQPRTQSTVVVGRRLRLLEEELAAFKKDLSNMHPQRRHSSTVGGSTDMPSGSGGMSRYSDINCSMNWNTRTDQEIQTSPSEGPSVWPPPAVHGSPRRRPATTRSREIPVASASGANKRRQPPKSELSHWVASKPGRRLARAKYSYKPLRDSPNENPELELSLEPGDYVLLYADMDEDYFYHGELFDGEQGLVPSNYVEIVPEEELAVSASHLQPANRAPLKVPSLRNSMVLSSNSLSTERHNGETARFSHGLFSTNPTAREFVASTNVKDYSQKQQPESFIGSSLPDSVCPYPTVDVSCVSVHEFRQPEGARVPCPRELLVERQLAKSVLISWSPPNNPLVPVAHYHVCIDGIVRAVIPGGYKTKALIEDVECQKNHRISVRAVTDTGQSPDSACTVTIGKDANVAPQDLKMSNLTPVSAQISWYPSNSNCEHMVLLNGLKVGTCPMGVSQVQMKGLIPSTMYRCSIRVKDPRAVLEEKPVESYTDFKTLPKIGLPDPPSNVQCELGPQDGTILVTWQPVTTQPKPPSRAAIVGYLVYADGKKLTEVDSPTGDHVLLRCSDLADDPPLFITVKAKTREGMVSSDSNVVRVPRILSGVTGIDMLNISTALPTTSSTIITSTAMPTLAASSVSPALPQQYSQQQQQSGPNTGSSGLLMIQQSPQVSSGVMAVGPQAYQNPLPAAMAMGANQTMIAGTPYALVATGNTNALTGTLTRQLLTNQNTSAGAPAASYYVFHPHLSQMESSTMDKPSLLEMENNYLIRQQQQRRNKMFASRRSYSLNDEENVQQSTGLPLSSTMLMHKRQQAAALPHIHVTGASGSEGPPSIVGYSDEDWDYSHVRQQPSSAQRPLASRYRRKLRQVDSRTLSEPDLRLDPRTGLGGRQRPRTRYVVALYDYNPRHMSPNPNGAHEELSFRKGQIILVQAEKDADGFYHGELNGRVGLVPSNLVVETDPESQHLMSRHGEQSPSNYAADLGDYPMYPKRISQQQQFVHPSDIRQHGSVDAYYNRRPYIPSDLERWGNSSDPSLARVRNVDYDYEVPPSLGGTVDRDRYAANPQQLDPRLRRSKFKHQSRSLDYDLDREDVGGERMYEEEKYMRQGSKPFREGRSGYAPQPVKQTDTFRGRSVDRYERDVYQPEYDEYAQSQRYRRDYADHETSRDAAGYRRQPPSTEYVGSLPRHGRYRGTRDREEYDANLQGSSMQRGNARYSNQQAFRDSKMRYSEPIYNSSQARDPRMVASSSRYDDIPQAPSQKDREYATTSARRLPQTRDDDRDTMRRRGRNGREGVEQGFRGDNRNMPPRQMVAAYDYDPKENSPNPGAEQEELTFRAGDFILVYGEKDEDGFFMGELNGRRGLVPSNFLSDLSDQPQFTLGGSLDTPSEGVSGATATSKSRREGVSFVEDSRNALTMDGNVLVDRSRQHQMGNMVQKPLAVAAPVAQKPTSVGAGPPRQMGNAVSNKQPQGTLKKTDSTVGIKTPPKKGSMPQPSGAAPAASRKTSVAAKPASAGGGK